MPTFPSKSSAARRDIAPIKRGQASSIVETISEKISNVDDALSVSSAVASLYVLSLDRLLEARTALDEARKSQPADDPQSKKALRAARFACEDEKNFLTLIDQVARGLCACLNTGKRIPLEWVAKLNSHKFQDPSDELRSQNTLLLFENTILSKSIMYDMPLPEEFLRYGLKGKPEADQATKSRALGLP